MIIETDASQEYWGAVLKACDCQEQKEKLETQEIGFKAQDIIEHPPLVGINTSLAGTKFYVYHQEYWGAVLKACDCQEQKEKLETQEIGFKAQDIIEHLDT